MGEGLRRRGRPPISGEAKRASFHTRLRESLRQRLDVEAVASGRSLSEEIEFRLEQSFLPARTFDERLNDLYGPNGAALLWVLGRLIRGAPLPITSVEENWLEEPFSCTNVAALLHAFADRLEQLNPIGSAVYPLNHDLTADEIRQDAQRNVEHLALMLGQEPPANPWFAARRDELGATAARFTRWRRTTLGGDE